MWTDPKTGETFVKGPEDFIDPNNTRTIFGRYPYPNPDFDQEQWTQEHEAWREYRDGQRQHLHEGEQYNSTTDHPHEEHHNFTDGPNFESPAVPGGSDTPGKGVTMVSTTALRTFAENIRSLWDPLDQAANSIQHVPVRAGGFQVAFNLDKAVSGEGGVVTQTRDFINQVQIVLEKVVNAANAVAHSYNTAEELNGMTSKQLGEYVTQLSGQVNGLTDSGGPAGGTS
jgi:hypothetical protein